MLNFADVVQGTIDCNVAGVKESGNGDAFEITCKSLW